jgi:hypothetical protein
MRVVAALAASALVLVSVPEDAGASQPVDPPAPAGQPPAISSITWGAHPSDGAQADVGQGAADALGPRPVVDAPAPASPSKDAKPARAPLAYSLPWQLRAVTAATVLRSDTSLASYEDAGAHHGRTIATGLTASVKIPGTGGPGSGLAVVARAMMAGDTPPAAPDEASATGGGLAVVNPLFGLAYAFEIGRWMRAGAFVGITAPIGAGGGSTPDKGLVNSRTKGAAARASMDTALFAVDDRAVLPGIDVAYVGHDLTVQLEATLIHMVRTRGEDAQPEATKTSLTSGLHVGYFFAPFVSVGSELRYQRWINAPFAAEQDPTGAAMDNLTVAAGPRFHIALGGGAWIRPGVAYWRGLDKPLAAATPNYNGMHIDVPVVF